jgi:hypothetical protein
MRLEAPELVRVFGEVVIDRFEDREASRRF